MKKLTPYAKGIMQKLQNNGNAPLMQDIEFGLTANKIRQLEATGYFQWNGMYNGIILNETGLSHKLD